LRSTASDLNVFAPSDRRVAMMGARGGQKVDQSCKSSFDSPLGKHLAIVLGGKVDSPQIPYRAFPGVIASMHDRPGGADRAVNVTESRRSTARQSCSLVQHSNLRIIDHAHLKRLDECFSIQPLYRIGRFDNGKDPDVKDFRFRL
jgi:hypothetical protein